MSDIKVNEYNALRSEILCWIQVEYTLIGLTAVSLSAALGFFKDEGSGSWLYFSSALLLTTSCLGCLTAFARTKIMFTSAYITVFHGQFTDWEELTRFTHDGKRVFARKYLFTIIHKVSLVMFYLVLSFAAVLYPYSLQKNVYYGITWTSGALFVVSIISIIAMLVITLISYNRQIYETAWNTLKAEEEGNRI